MGRFTVRKKATCPYCARWACKKCGRLRSQPIKRANGVMYRCRHCEIITEGALIGVRHVTKECEA